MNNRMPKLLVACLAVVATLAPIHTVSAATGKCSTRGHVSQGMICLPSADKKSLVWQPIPREGRRCLLPKVMYGTLACTRVNGRPVWKDLIPTTGYSWKITPHSTNSVLPSVITGIERALKKFQTPTGYFPNRFVTFHADLARIAAKYKVRIRELDASTGNYEIYYRITTVEGSTCVGESNSVPGDRTSPVLDPIDCRSREPLTSTTFPQD